MRDAVDPPDFHPPRGGQFVDEPLNTQLRVIRVVQDEIAPGDEVRRPGVEVRRTPSYEWSPSSHRRATGSVHPGPRISLLVLRSRTCRWAPVRTMFRKKAALSEAPNSPPL